MMKTGILIAATLIGVVACSPTVVPTERGIGFDNPTDRAVREAQLSTPRGTIVPAPQVNTIPSQVPLTSPNAIPTSALAAAGIGAPAATAQTDTTRDPLRVQGLDASPSNPAPLLENGTTLSDEQNFDAVAGRETIESDAERRAAQAAAREQITPTAVPTRPANVGPDIVAFALAAPNVKGQEWYSRSLLSGEGRFRRNCANYNNADQAQRDFLARGGPDRDRRGIDPDGDGFACGWDPAPFIQAFRN
jgi:hypothetical protein